jgi:hypothetical protein
MDVLPSAVLIEVAVVLRPAEENVHFPADQLGNVDTHDLAIGDNHTGFDTPLFGAGERPLRGFTQR